jgi:hypothetical protein
MTSAWVVAAPASQDPSPPRTARLLRLPADAAPGRPVSGQRRAAPDLRRSRSRREARPTENSPTYGVDLNLDFERAQTRDRIT